MTTKRFAIAICIAIVAVGAWLLWPAPSPKPFNVLLITMDTTRADHLGCYGNEIISTPHIDALAKQGTLYQNAFTPVPITLPSHTSMMSGTYPVFHGVRENAGFYVPDEMDMLAEILDDNGYDTAAFVGAFPLDSQTGIDQGFDLYDDNYASRFDRHPKLQRFYDERPAADVARGAMAWIDDRDQAPFFLWTHFFDPHHPLLPPPRYRDQYPTDPYLAEIASVDEAIGQILARLEARGMLDSTLVILTADHGEGRGEHGEETHALLLYSSTLRVPLIVNDPRHRQPGNEPRVVNAPVSNLDIFSTVLDRLNMPIPDVNQGTPLPDSDRYADPEREILSETMFGRLIYGWSPLHRLTAGTEVHIRGPSQRLFDRANDPGELTDLSSTHAHKLNRISEQLSNARGAFAEGGHEFASAPVTPETIARLAALGYIGVSTAPAELSDEVDPTRADPLAMMKVFDYQQEAQSLAEEGQLELAIPLLRKAEKIDPQNPAVLLTLAQSLLSRADQKAAFDVLIQLLKAQPENVRAHLLLAQYHRSREEYEQAMELMRNAVELDSEDLATRLMLAHLEEDAARPDLAETTYRDLIERDPTHVLALNGLATLKYRSGASEEAVGLLNDTLNRQPYYAPAYLNLGVIHFDQGQYDRALRLARRALAVAPGYRNARELERRSMAALTRATADSD
ncbi:MAG: hypothetical protein DHS20C11_23470 [Lysobacteraceae bacterium]|nr:MAG: hypothetical protein DHS20C11_23470 [Xanthomonadaceae bacterium]